MMKANWSVFMRRLKTPPYDYTQLREIAFLIFTPSMSLVVLDS